MKKILQLTLVALVITLILPGIALASWWNPFSWNWGGLFSSSKQTETTQIATTTATTTKIQSKTKTVIPKNDEGNLNTNLISNQTTSIPISTQPTKTNDQICQDSYGSASIYSSQNNNGGLICGCISGYEWNSSRTSCVITPVKTGYQVCAEMNATWDGTYINNKQYNCTCSTGYTSSSDGKTCVLAPVRTGYQVCSESYSNETWDGTYSNDGKYNCVCVAGYGWDNNQESCQPIRQQSYTSGDSVACQKARQNLETFEQQHPITSPVGEGNTAILLQSIAYQQQSLAQAVQYACQ